jgi:phospholipid/cholesterol/gamma-HCH transport system substrate-binding protein
MAAILVVVLIGYVAYTANRGLPWQRTQEFTIEVPNAERLIDSAEVRIAGNRVGQVIDVEAIAGRGGAPHARLKVALDRSIRMPADSTAQVRPASVLGLTYVDLRLGAGDREIPVGGTLPLQQAKTSADLTDLLEVFDRRTAHSFQQVLGDLSSGWAGRGPSVNAALRSFSEFLPKWTRVADALAAERTRLPDFLRAYRSAVTALAPVNQELAGLVSGGAAAFGAVAAEKRALGEAIELAPSTETAVTDAFRAVRPGLDGLARVAVALRPAGRVLPRTLRRVNATLSAGAPALRALPALEAPLGTALGALDRLSRDSNTDGSLRKLTDLASAARGALVQLVPAQVHCNVISLFAQGFAGTFGTLGTGEGPALGALFLAETGAQGENLQNARPSANAGINPLPNVNEHECEAHNEPWTGRQQLGNPPGLQSKRVRPTVPPPGVPELARRAGLLTDPEGLR